MDIQRKKKKGFKTKHLKWAVLGGVCAVCLFFFATTDFTTTRVKRDALSVGTVKQGDFYVTVFGNGILRPRDIEWIASQVDGTVSKILARPGDYVESGQTIVTLTNPDLVNRAEEANMALHAGEANLQALEARLQGEKVNQEAEVAIAELNYEEAELELKANSKLFHSDNPIVSKRKYEQKQLAAKQSKIRFEVEKKRLEQNTQNIKAQINAESFRVSQLEQSYLRASQLAEQLNVVAGMTGVVQALPVEIGQRLVPGTEVSRVARQDHLYAEIKISPRQATDVHIGHPVLVDTRKGTIEGRVSRIDPSVREGRIEVEVELIGELPSSARPDLNVYATITVSQIENTLYVEKPSGTDDDSRFMVYVLDSQSTYAEQRKVQFGKASTDRIEVVSGLSPGEKIILSDSSNWNDNRRIHLN